MAKSFEQRTEEINGTTYVFQFPGIRAANEMSDRCKNQHGVVMQTKMTEEFFKHVIVEPKVNWDYFEEKPEDFSEVIKVANEVFQGPFQGK